MIRLPDSRASRAILIGTSQYSDVHLPELPVVRKTVNDLAGALTHPLYGVIEDANCTIILDEGDLRRVGKRLQAVTSEAEDLLLVFFAGHGLIAGQRHELYLGLTDSDWAYPEFSSLEYDKLRSIILDSPARAKVIILDCCFSGRVMSGTMTGRREAIIGQLDIIGTCVLTSAQRDQIALILPGEQHTAFTGRLIYLLENGLTESGWLLSVDDLYRQLVIMMKSGNLPEPQIRRTQTAGSIALGHNRSRPAYRRVALLQRHHEAVQLAEDGRWDSSVTLLRKICAEQLELLGSSHEDTLKTRQYLAHSEGWRGNPAHAAELLAHILEEELLILPPEHEDVLRTRQFLAVNLGQAGHYADAVSMLTSLFSDRRRILGAKNPHTLRTAHMLALNLAASGAKDPAAELLDEVIRFRESVLGSEHAHTLRAKRDRDQLCID